MNLFNNRNVQMSSSFSRSYYRILISCVLSFASVAVHAAEPVLTQVNQHFDGVLGTSLDISIFGVDSARMEAAAAASVSEIARLEQILSTWIEDSELMQLNRSRSTTEASPELLEVVQLCEDWFRRTAGIFSCRLGQIMNLWDAAERNQAMPKVSDMLPTARAANSAAIVINARERLIELGDSINLEPSGLAKGYIIDRAMAVLRAELPDAVAIKLDIGGDAIYWGSPPDRNGWLVNVADPVTVADNAGFISSLDLNGRAIATSGHTSRTRKIGERAFSHIFDSKRGWPVQGGVYAAVLAPDAVTADAVATTLAAQSLEPALAWLDTQENIEALLISPDGASRASENWRTYLSTESLKFADAKVNLTLDYKIPNLNERGYERPYVAIWISDKDGRAIKNLLLLGTDQRWASSNSRWWNSATTRIDNVSRPTRPPGEYQLVWDGKDEQGFVLPPGEYVLNMEASRQNGDHTYKRIRFPLADGIQTFEQQGEKELGDFKVTVEMTIPQ